MRIDILGVGFDNLTMTEAVARGCELLAGEGAHYVVTPNPEIVETCRADAEAMAAVNGADLMDIGIPAGPGVGATLQTLLNDVMEGTLPNEREALLAAAVKE